MEILSTEYLQELNGGGFWEDAGEWIAEHTVKGTWNQAMDAYCRYEYGVSYKTMCKSSGYGTRN